ncbi:MAG: 50S ribosomal protein L35 [Erysipelotrichales bacterium]|jgi:large subunit ribosomal protein L35|nr:50S ribosomal protein L35 [Erysipelotrichales bacterium]
MPKMKTSSSLAKRVKKTGSGKYRRFHAYVSHLAPHKSHKQKKHLAKSAIVNKSDMKRIKDMLQG